MALEDPQKRTFREWGFILLPGLSDAAAVARLSDWLDGLRDSELEPDTAVSWGRYDCKLMSEAWQVRRDEARSDDTYRM